MTMFTMNPPIIMVSTIIPIVIPTTTVMTISMVITTAVAQPD